MSILGTKRFCDDIYEMIDYYPGRFWCYCWKYITPVCVAVILLGYLRDFLGVINFEIFYSSYCAWAFMHTSRWRSDAQARFIVTRIGRTRADGWLRPLRAYAFQLLPFISSSSPKALLCRLVFSSLILTTKYNS